MQSLPEKFGLAGPLIVAPMGGGPTTPELVAASSNAGALGSLAGAYLSPEQLDAAIARTRSLTSRPFAVNLFVPAPVPRFSDAQIQEALAATREYRTELGLSDPSLSPPYHPDFYRQFEVLLRSRPAAFSFVFGCLEKEIFDECRKAGIYTMGTATTLEEALSLEACGVDAVIAQGVEAGGHRGMFSADAPDPLIGTLSLTRVLVSRLRVPVIAAGGIMDGAGIAAALSLGAQAAQLGTAFLACDEAGISKPYREILLSPRKRPTRLMRAFSGRWARGFENRFSREMALKDSSVLPFPAQNAFTRDLRNESARVGNPEFLSLWAGSGVELIRAMPAGDLVRTLFAEFDAAKLRT